METETNEGYEVDDVAQGITQNMVTRMPFVLSSLWNDFYTPVASEPTS